MTFTFGHGPGLFDVTIHVAPFTLFFRPSPKAWRWRESKSKGVFKLWARGPVAVVRWGD